VSERDDRARTLACFAGLPRRERLHVRGRWASCPIPALEAEVPRAGRILEVGCGHGLVSVHLALRSPARRVTGTDIDRHKIELATRAAASLPDDRRPHFAHRPDGSVPDGPWDAIVVVDVLYLLAPPDEAALLDACVAQLAPGGVLLCKETDVEPRWKHRLAAAQEVLATRVLRITEGDTVQFTPIAQLASSLRERGLEVSQRRLDRGSLHPHALVVARRPVRGSTGA
jgi:2-polyprenyl-3-methyl-5-hydroxy-6-metoxy-1,4-benzoquinol methylase